MLPAVYASEETGVLANLTVWVADGTGHVFVDTKPFAQGRYAGVRQVVLDGGV
jgi:predicted S18 family serine protease